MKVYISGPMTGIKDYNFPAFNAAEAQLLLRGYEVENPASKGIVEGWEWTDYLAFDLRIITECDAIYTLPGWQDSRGACLEMHVARELGKTWLNEPTDREVRVTSASGGQKGSKQARFDLIPAAPLRTLAELYGKGAEKYEDRNWERGYDWSLSFAALNRHLWQFWSGEDNDTETGKPHLASVAWHAFALLEFMQTHPDYDNRPKP